MWGSILNLEDPLSLHLPNHDFALTFRVTSQQQHTCVLHRALSVRCSAQTKGVAGLRSVREQPSESKVGSRLLTCQSNQILQREALRHSFLQAFAPQDAGMSIFKPFLGVGQSLHPCHTAWIRHKKSCQANDRKLYNLLVDHVHIY